MSALRRLPHAAAAVGSVGAALATAHTLANLARLRRPPAPPPEVATAVSVLVPARDEAGRVGRCLSAVRAQRGLRRLEVVVLDDRSTDGTAQVVRQHVTADPRVRMLSGADEPPAGWLGKPWACARLAEAATGDVLVFVDADVVLEPDALARVVATMGQARLDAVSPYPRQLAVTAPERLVQPLLQWSWLTFLPLGPAETSARESLVAANGQLLAVKADSYRRAGGHAAVAGEVLDDVALFRALKRAGYRAVVVDGTDLATCRMYEGWPQLRDGYTKSLWAAFGSPAGAAGAVGLLGLLYVVPPVAALAGARIGWAGYAAGVLGRVVVGRRVGSRVWPDALAHPVSVAALGYLTASSWRRRRRGQLTWKGRPVVAAAQPRSAARSRA
jgi:hypothetical protein